MAINLKKGEKISLTKAAPGLVRAIIGLGWDARATSGADFDLDASAFRLTESGKVQGRFRSTGVKPKILDRLRVAGIDLPPSVFDEVVEVNM